MGVLDLKGQLGFYGSYHNNKWNKLIHIVFVPTIVWTALVFLGALGPIFQHQQQLDSLLPFFTPLSRSLPTALQPYFSFNYGLPLVLFYSTYYILLEPFAGVTASGLLFTLWLLANKFVLGNPSAVSFALALHIFSWTMQFIGHGVAEGRKPALLDNLFQSFVLAPFFVWFEVLFTLGYRPTLHKEINADVQKSIQEWKSKKKA